MVQRPIHTARLQNVFTLSERAQTKHFEFVIEDLEHFDFKAGQFLSLLAKNGEKTITRAYSIASSPRGDNTFDLCLNRVENGFFSNHLCDMETGRTVDFHGPHGLFVLRQPLRDCLMIATGTGIAPMRGFVEWLFGPTPRHEGRQIYLIFGTRYEQDIYYREEFERIARENSNFHYIITLSRPSEGWTGGRGYVQEHVKRLLESYPDQARDHMDAYICGLNDMVKANRELLASYGWEKKQVLFERYD